MFQQIIWKNPTYPMIMMIMLAGLKSTQRGIGIKKNFNIDYQRQNELKCRLLNVAGHQDTQLFSKHEGLYVLVGPNSSERDKRCHGTRCLRDVRVLETRQRSYE